MKRLPVTSCIGVWTIVLHDESRCTRLCSTTCHCRIYYCTSLPSSIARIYTYRAIESSLYISTSPTHCRIHISLGGDIACSCWSRSTESIDISTDPSIWICTIVLSDCIGSCKIHSTRIISSVTNLWDNDTTIRPCITWLSNDDRILSIFESESHLFGWCSDSAIGIVIPLSCPIMSPDNICGCTCRSIFIRIDLEMDHTIVSWGSWELDDDGTIGRSGYRPAC